MIDYNVEVYRQKNQTESGLARGSVGEGVYTDGCQGLEPNSTRFLLLVGRSVYRVLFLQFALWCCLIVLHSGRGTRGVGRSEETKASRHNNNLHRIAY